MDIKDILLLVRPGEDCAAATAAAAQLAKAFGAQVRAICLAPLPSIDEADCYAIGADAVRDVLARMNREAEALAASAEGPVRKAFEASGCAYSWTRTPAGESAAETALRARACDLVVMTRPAAADAGARLLSETLVRMGGSPCLLVPQAASIRGFNRIVLAWNGSRQCKRAMADAMALFVQAAIVDVVVVSGREESVHSEGLVVEHLRRHGVTADAVALARPHDGCAAALSDWCRDHNADLLVMGAFGRAPQAEHWLGGVTWTILTSAVVPVLMSC